jgi:hypothetical protein
VFRIGLRPLFAFTRSLNVARSLHLSRALHPCLLDFSKNDPHATIEAALTRLKQRSLLRSGEPVITISEVLVGEFYHRIGSPAPSLMPGHGRRGFQLRLFRVGGISAPWNSLSCVTPMPGTTAIRKEMPPAPSSPKDETKSDASVNSCAASTMSPTSPNCPALTRVTSGRGQEAK